MVTHDVDEAVLLADRIVMMTNGPAAMIGEILDVSWPARAIGWRCAQPDLSRVRERSAAVSYQKQGQSRSCCLSAQRQKMAFDFAQPQRQRLVVVGQRHGGHAHTSKNC